MDLKTFIADMERRSRLATACKTSGDWLYQIATNWKGKQAGVELAQAIERESEIIGPEKVPKESLRPDVWPPIGESTDVPPHAPGSSSTMSAAA